MDITKLGSDRVQEQRTQDAHAAAKAKATQQTNADGSVKKSDAASEGTSTEKVKWSADAQTAAEGLQAAKNAPDTRADKVAAIKAAIANGSYKMDSTKIADRMISRSLEDDLLTRNS